MWKKGKIASYSYKKSLSIFRVNDLWKTLVLKGSIISDSLLDILIARLILNHANENFVKVSVSQDFFYFIQLEIA